MSGGGGGGSQEIEETPEEKELAQIAGERWQEYQGTFRPLESQYMGEIEDLGSSEAMSRVTGQAASSAQQGADMGPINPNTGTQGQGRAIGQARAQAVSDAGTQLEGQHKRGLQSVIQIGQGQSANALQGLGEVAGQAAQEAQQEAFADFNRRQAWGNLAGNVAGAGVRYGIEGMGQNPQGGPQPQGDSQPQGDFSMGYGLPPWNRGNRGQ